MGKGFAVVKVIKLTSEYYEKYNEYLCKKDALFYVSLKYKDFLEKLLDDESYYLIAIDNKEIVGILPLFIRRNAEMGNVMNSLPFYGSNGGIIADNDDVRHVLLNNYYDMADREKCVSTTIINSPFDKNVDWYEENIAYDYRDQRIGQITFLPDKSDNIEEELLGLYHNMVRRCIKKAQKNEISVGIDNSMEAFSFLYDTHVDNMNRIGGLSKDKKFFDLIPDSFEAGKDYNIYTAKISNKRIAALLIFYYNSTVEYFTPVTLDEYRTYQPLSLIVYQAMQDAVLRGYKKWNWGGTWMTQEGVYDFKRKWGTQDLYYYYYINIYNKKILDVDKSQILSLYKNYYLFPFNV